MPKKLKGVRRVMIRPFLAELLGLNVRQVSRLFNGARSKVDVQLVRAYLLANGYRDSVEPRRKQVDVGLRLIGSDRDRLA